MVRAPVRYHAKARVIVLAWVNDTDTRRAYESTDDAYRVFRRMLDSGHPPDDWDRLMTEACAEMERLRQTGAPLSATIPGSN